MKKLGCTIVLASLMTILGCGGGDSSSEGDDSSSSNSSSNSQQTADAGTSSSDTDSGTADETRPETAENGATSPSGTDSSDTQSDSASNESANRSGGGSEELGSSDRNDTDTSTADDSDPIRALVLSFGNAQLAAQYTQVRNAADAETAGPQELYGEVLLLQQLGATLLNAGRRDDALPAFKESYLCAIAAEEKLGSHPEEANELLSNVYYNGACVLSLTGEIEDAYAALERSIEMGFSDSELLKTDSDLDALRERDGFDDDLAGWLATIEATNQIEFDFQVTDLEGNEQSLESLQGKVVIVELWGTWSPECRESATSLIKLQEKFGDEGLQVIGLNYERVPDEEAPTIIRDFVAENGINYPCAVGNPALRAQVPDFQEYPTTLFIDRSGVVRNLTAGLQTYDSLEEQVIPLLKEPVESDE